MPIILNNGIKVHNNETTQGTNVRDLKPDELFVSSPDQIGKRHAFSLEELEDYFAKYKTLVNFYNRKPFSLSDLQEMLQRSPKLRSQVQDYIEETAKDVALISNQTRREMTLFFENVGVAAENENILTDYLAQMNNSADSAQTMAQFHDAGVADADLIRSITFNRFKQYYDSLSDDEKKAIDNFPGNKKSLSKYLIESLGDIFKLPADTCLGGTSGFCRDFIYTLNFIDQLSSLSQNSATYGIANADNSNNNNNNSGFKSIKDIYNNFNVFANKSIKGITDTLFNLKIKTNSRDADEDSSNDSDRDNERNFTNKKK